jgi:hypothetical protein
MHPLRRNEEKYTYNVSFCRTRLRDWQKARRMQSEHVTDVITLCHRLRIGRALRKRLGISEHLNQMAGNIRWSKNKIKAMTHDLQSNQDMLAVVQAQIKLRIESIPPLVDGPGCGVPKVYVPKV